MRSSFWHPAIPASSVGKLQKAQLDTVTSLRTHCLQPSQQSLCMALRRMSALESWLPA